VKPALGMHRDMRGWIEVCIDVPEPYDPLQLQIHIGFDGSLYMYSFDAEKKPDYETVHSSLV
jgi:S-formylglutathione hydrolase FrmB